MAYKGIEKYLHYVRFQKMRSQNTLLSYDLELKRFAEFCKRKNVRIKLLNSSQVTRYIQELTEIHKLKPRSIYHALMSIRQFYAYLVDEGIIPKNPINTIHIRYDCPKKEVLTKDEVNILLESFTKPNQRAMLEFLYSTGCRVSEMLMLKTANIDLINKKAKILGKGNKERFVHLTDTAIEWMKKHDGFTKEWFFFPYSRLSVHRLLKQAAKDTGISKQVSPHTIRHTFATHMLKNGTDLISLKEMMGHKSIASTQVYTHLTFEDIQEAHTKYHPRR